MEETECREWTDDRGYSDMKPRPGGPVDLGVLRGKANTT